MIQFANSQNVTWDYTPIGYWSTFEVHVGVIFACLPALRSLQHRIFPDSRSSRSYYTGASGAYGYNSKGDSPFPSIAKYKKGQSDLMTANSQASMLRSHDRTKTTKDFIQLEEYEFRLGDGMSTIEKDEFSRGLNHTQIERGSVHTNDGIRSPIQGTHDLPLPKTQKRSHLSEQTRVEGLPQVITVRKDYSVTVEITPEPISSTPPGLREEENIFGPEHERNRSQSSHRVGSRSVSRSTSQTKLHGAG